MKKRNMKKEWTTILMIAFAISCASFSVSGAYDTNLTSTTVQEASTCLNNSEAIMNEMLSQGFNVLRINDSLKQAELLYNSQVVLQKEKKGYDFSVVLPYCQNIAEIQNNATDARDAFSSLLKFYNGSITPGMNTETIDTTIQEIENEIKNERYENVKPLIDRGYSEITLITSSYSAVGVFLDATTVGIKRFLIKNWMVLTIVITVLIILFIIFKPRIMKKIINRKIKNLTIRKNTIKQLIMDTQRNYFQNGTISEDQYEVKTNKFAELVRDIERQLPLLEEDLARLERRSGPVENETKIAGRKKKL